MAKQTAAKPIPAACAETEQDQLREDLADAAAADAALAEMAEPGVEPVPLEELLAKHGL